MQRIKSTICESSTTSSERKSGVEHAGHPPSSESYLLLSPASFFSPLSSIAFNIKKNLKKNTTYYDTAYGQSSCFSFFFGGLAVIIMGDGPTRLRFFAGARVAAERQMRKGLDS